MNKIFNFRVENFDYSKEKSNLKLSKREPRFTLLILRYLEESLYDKFKIKKITDTLRGV